MEDDRPGDSPLAYRQWDDNPTWCLDRGRDDRHMDPPDVPVGASSVSGFHAALVTQKEKHAQVGDAAVAFLGFKTAGALMSAAKSLGGMAMRHPHAAGAAVGAVGGAIAGGPNHRLSGAAMGAGVGAAAGHMAKPMLGRMAESAEGSSLKQLGQKALGGGAAKPAAAAAGGMKTPNLPAKPNYDYVAESGQVMGAKGQAVPAPKGQSPMDLISHEPPAGVPSSQPNMGHMPTQAMPAMPAQTATSSYQPPPGSTPPVMGQPVPPGMAGGVAPRSAYRARRGDMSGNADPFAGMSQVQGTPNPAAASRGAQTVQLKHAMLLKKASLPPFAVAVDPSNAAASGGSSAMSKEAGIFESLAKRIKPSAAQKLGPLSQRPVPFSGSVLPEHAHLRFIDDPSGGRRAVPKGIMNSAHDIQNLKLASSSKIASLISDITTEGMAHVHPSTRRFPTAAVIGVLDDGEMIARRKVQEAITRHTNMQQDQNPEEPHIKVATPIDSTPLFDAKQRAADRFPEKISPIEAIRTDFKSALNLLQDKVRDIGQKKHELADPTTKTAEPKAGITTGRAILERIFPKHVLTPEGAGIAIGGGLMGAGMGYMGSRGKKEHGGRSEAEVATENWKNKQPEKPDGILPTIGKHVADLHSDVAHQMRKHPVASTALGGMAGATIALRLASLAGLGSHLK